MNNNAPSLKFQLGEGTNWVDLGATTNFANDATVGKWVLNYADGIFNADGTYYIRLLNNQSSASGNDLGLDNIFFGLRHLAPSVGTEPGDENPGTFDITNWSQSPVVSSTGTTSFTEQTPITASDTITISDPDGDTDWNGGSLKVQITANNEASDRLTLPTSDPGTGAIWIDDTSVKTGSTVIGTADASSSVSDGTAWTITFNENATNALVQGTARAILFENFSNNPGTA